MTYTCSRFYYTHIVPGSAATASQRQVQVVDQQQQTSAMQGLPQEARGGALRAKGHSSVQSRSHRCGEHWEIVLYIILFTCYNYIYIKRENFRRSQCERYGQFQVINRWTPPLELGEMLSRWVQSPSDHWPHWHQNLTGGSSVHIVYVHIHCHIIAASSELEPCWLAYPNPHPNIWSWEVAVTVALMILIPSMFHPVIQQKYTNIMKRKQR